MRSLFTCALLALLAPIATAGVIPLDDRAWSRLTPPTVPYSTVSTYDPSHDRAILLPSGFSPAGETWQAFFAGAHGWARTVASPEAPDPGRVRGAIYNLRHGLLAFARRPEDPAYGPGSLGVWSVGSKGVGGWSRLAVDSDGPSDRWSFAVVNDTRRDRIVLFGGGPWASEPGNSDTWTLDLSVEPLRWRKLSLPVDPPARANMAAAYDSVSDHVFIYGGAKRFPNGGAVSATNELWSLDLSTADAWDSLGTNGPGPDAPFNAALSPIPGTHALLLCERAFQTVQLWRLDLDGAPAWTKLADAPAAVANSSIALLGPTYDRRWYVLTAPADSWTFELAHPGEWHLENAPFATGPEFNPQILLSDPVTGTDLATELIGEFEDADGFHQVDSPDVWRLAPALPPVWTRVDGAGEGPSNFSAFARAYDSRRLRWILFGFVGTDMPRSTVEAWSLSVGAQPRWSKLAFDGALPAHLYGAGVAYDALRDRIVTFGGGFGQASADVNVLELSGTPRWRAIATAGAAPHSRYGSALAFDTARDRYLMFGGTTSRQTATEPEITSYHDVWSLHVGATATWDSVSTTGSRAGQWNSLAFFDPARDAMGVIGGEGLVLNPEYQDLHELSLGQVSAWDSWPDRSDSAPPGNRLGANIQMQYAVDLGLDRVVRVRDGHELWMLDRRAPTHIALLDLSPGDATNTLRADAHGLVTCAILSDAAFDARTVDPSSVTLAGAPAHTAVAADRATLRDVNGDGRLDRVLKFGRADMTLDPSVDLVALAGKTRTGEAIVGWALYNVADARAGASGDRVAGGTGFATDGDPDAPISLPAHLALTIAGPVRGAASMRLALPHAASDGVIEIFAVDGRRVARRDLGALEAGTRAIALGETSSLASGIYFARVSVAGETASARFVALR